MQRVIDQDMVTFAYEYSVSDMIAELAADAIQERDAWQSPHEIERLDTVATNAVAADGTRFGAVAIGGLALATEYVESPVLRIVAGAACIPGVASTGFSLLAAGVSRRDQTAIAEVRKITRERADRRLKQREGIDTASLNKDLPGEVLARIEAFERSAMETAGQKLELAWKQTPVAIGASGIKSDSTGAKAFNVTVEDCINRKIMRQPGPEL